MYVEEAGLAYLSYVNWYEFKKKKKRLRTKEIVFEFSQSNVSLWPLDAFHNKKEV